MILDIPDVRQAKEYDCGAAAIDAAASFFGLRRRGPEKCANPIQGMAPDTVACVLRALGLRVLHGQMLGGVETLRHFTRQGCPILCCVTLAAGGHWVVVRGVSRGRVYFHDPTYGPRWLPQAEWLACWHDTSAESLQPFPSWGIVCAR